MKVIYKYPLDIIDNQLITMPLGAQILSVQMQHDQPQLWALVDNEQSMMQERHIKIYGTGNPITGTAGRYISTFQMNGGSLIWHAFEK